MTPANLLRSLAVGLLLLLIIGRALAQDTAVRAVAAVGVTVGDMDRSLDFYTGILDFQVVSDTEVAGEAHEELTGVFGLRCRVVTLRLGDELLQLTEYLASPGRPIPPDSRSNDRWFQHIAIITSDMDAAYARLRAHKVRHASTGPQTLPDYLSKIPGAGPAGIRAFYFHDPDGHALEILKFPADKGDPKWHDRPGLFLGIDHTAIVVADTDTSLAFYRDLLGLRVVGNSENYGPEQAHLNNVRNAHLRITTLKADSGPGVELLEYLQPRDGRAYPDDALPNDLFHWHTVVHASDDTLATRLGATPVTVNDVPTYLCRDPDGHAVLVVGQ